MSADDPKNQFEILNGGTNLEVTFVDGAKETVKVKKVSMRDMQKLSMAWTREEKELLIYTGKDDAWLDRLQESSWETLITEGRRLNFLTFKKYFERQQQAVMAVAVVNEEKLLKAATEMAREDLPKPTNS